MGMDIYGRAPKSEKGEYFRSNIWSWPTILDAIVETGVLPEEMVESMAYNDGAGPNDEQAMALAAALDKKMAEFDGANTFISENSKYANVGTATVATALYAKLEADEEMTAIRAGDGGMTRFSANVEFIREFADFCRDSGGFNVW